jgi:hypothetical protein
LDRRRIAIHVAVMAMIGLLLGFLGPFGTFGYLQTGPRLVYWLVMIAMGSVIFEVGLWLAFRLRPPPAYSWAATLALLCPIVAAPITAGVVAISSLFDIKTEDYGLLYVQVLVISAVVIVVIVLIRLVQGDIPSPRVSAIGFVPPDTPGLAAAPPAAEGPGPFLRRLPERLRAARLLAIEAEDHYLRIHTTSGSDLVLMRLADAVAELQGVDGRKVHRSFWVARDAVEGIEREGTRVRLVLTGGLVVPVSRARQAELRAAGWISGEGANGDQAARA